MTENNGAQQQYKEWLYFFFGQAAAIDIVAEIQVSIIIRKRSSQ